MGEKIEYRLCNTQECGSAAPDYREEMCSNFEGVTGLSWETFSPPSDGELVATVTKKA